LINDGTADSAEPEPQNPNVPRASGSSGTEGSGGGDSQQTDDDIWQELDELNNPTPEILREAQAIANGHAFNDHRGEFPEIENREEFAQLIDDIMNNPSEVKPLSNGRTAYWDATSNTLVIKDPGDIDGGTAFRPTERKNYFDRL
jgi:filamentous hemagglutinin